MLFIGDWRNYKLHFLKEKTYAELVKGLETKRCQLNSLREEDFPSFLELQQNLKTREFLGGPVDKETVEKKFSSYLKASFPEQHFAVRLKEKGFIGVISLNKAEDKVEDKAEELKALEISYHFLPEHWGKGLAHETLLEVLGFSFSKLGASFLVAETQAKNQRSIALLEKLGFREKSEVIRFEEKQKIFSIGPKNGQT